MPKDPTKTAITIQKILNKYSLYLKFLVLGPSALTKAEVRSLLLAGMIDPAKIKFTLGDAYLDAHFKALRRASRRPVRAYALKHIQATAGQFIDKFLEKQVAELGGMVNNQLLTHLRQLRDATKEELARGTIEHKTSKEMARQLRNKTQDYAKDWDRVVTTELARAQNLGSFDAIVENNVDRAQNEIYVYKVGPHDSKTCKYCKKFWFLSDGVTPKVYKLSELVANGSNMGKKAKDWEATVDNTHPNERHYLQELPVGFGFKNGALSYVKKGWIEYNHQRGR